MSAALPAKPAPGLPNKLAAVARDIKLGHTVFAMPFALLATFLSAGWAGRLPGVDEFVLIVVCMFLARTVAMTMNRVIDSNLDASNPRTAQRAIPSGKLNGTFVRATAVTCAVLFVLATWGFYVFRENAWPTILSPFVLAYLVGYSYTKLLTWLCHLYLGIALALSPIAAVIAIEPGYLGNIEPWLLAGMVTCWVGGFDVIYALQDVEHDRSLGLYSMPAKLGEENALWVSRFLHLCAAGCLLGLWYASPVLSVLFLVAACITIALLLLEHMLVWRSRTHHIDTAFLTVNGVISLMLGVVGILEVCLT